MTRWFLEFVHKVWAPAPAITVSSRLRTLWTDTRRPSASAGGGTFVCLSSARSRWGRPQGVWRLAYEIEGLGYVISTWSNIAWDWANDKVSQGRYWPSYRGDVRRFGSNGSRGTPTGSLGSSSIGSTGTPCVRSSGLTALCRFLNKSSTQAPDSSSSSTLSTRNLAWSSSIRGLPFVKWYRLRLRRCCWTSSD